MRLGNKRIVDYYDQSEVDYKLVWDLGESLAMHYGYWDSSVKNLRQALARENKILASIARIKKSDLVLDAGCGVGGSAIFLAKEIGARVVGVTLSEKQVESAFENAQRRGVLEKVKFYQKDFTKTGFRTGSFDVVWAVESVCHAQEKMEFIKEAFRILKPGGRLILADGFAMRERYFGGAQKIMDAWLLNWGVESLETADNFQKLLKQSGFSKIKFKDVTSNIMPSAKRLYMLSFPALGFTKIAQKIGIRTKLQTGNVIAAYFQYKALKGNLCQYGFIFAVK